MPLRWKTCLSSFIRCFTPHPPPMTPCWLSPPPEFASLPLLMTLLFIVPATRPHTIATGNDPFVYCPPPDPTSLLPLIKHSSIVTADCPFITTACSLHEVPTLLISPQFITTATRLLINCCCHSPAQLITAARCPHLPTHSLTPLARPSTATPRPPH